MWHFLFFVSIILNFILFFKIKNLKAQLRTKKRKVQAALHTPLSTLEIELDQDIILPDLPIEDECVVNNKSNIAIKNDTLKKNTLKKKPIKEITSKENILSSVLQSISGWHHAFIPFLLQNIGWFIGILCFISGSIFFVSYTQGFIKSLTITYTILSYTLLLAWGGYYLKKNIDHANTSGMVLLSMSFLLVPLNFSALTRLLMVSLDSGLLSVTFIVSVSSLFIASALLFYISKLISGLFNRDLLSHFYYLFFTISVLQLAIPLIRYSPNNMSVLILFSVIMSLLLLALVFYLPVILQHVFVDKKYLILFSVGSLIFASLVSMIHIAISSPVNIPLNFYAPFILLISMLLFYLDDQLHHYKEIGGLVSYMTLICYALSFCALALSFDAPFIRSLTNILAIILYARLMWIYRSLVPLYLVLILTAFLYSDHVINPFSQWLYISLLPLLLTYFFLLLLLIKKGTEPNKEKSLQLSRHLFHALMMIAIIAGVFSQWRVESLLVALLNGLILLFSVYYLLTAHSVSAIKLVNLTYYDTYFYLLTLLPILLILITPILSVEIKLILLTLIMLFYAHNSHYQWFTVYKHTSLVERRLFMNSSLLIMLLLLVLVVIGFTLSVKIAFLIFILALNSLFLSMSLYNRALFYIFILLLAVSSIILKLYLNTPPSSGVMLTLILFSLFLVMSVLDRTKQTTLEHEHIKTIRRNTPEKLLGCYPINDYEPDNINKEVL